MAYVDRKSASQRAASLASAAILQGGIGAILIYGLATTYLAPTSDPIVQATDIPLPPPPRHDPDPAPTDTPHTSPSSSIDQVVPPLDTNPTGPVFDPGPTVDPHPYVAPVPTPTFAPPPPTPRFLPQAARPLGDRSRWVTTDDYPASEIRKDHAGVTGYRVAIAASGKVTGCEVVKSSGWPKLDEAACANVTRRARFEPGTDTSGAKTASSYSGSVVWTIPR